MEVTFAQTRYSYQSYTDYWRLVQLEKFPTCYVDEIDFTQERVYIVSPLNGEWRPYRDAHRSVDYRARVIWWCLERPGPDWTQGMAPFRQGVKELLDDWYFDKVWLSDRYLASLMHDARVSFVVLGSHVGLGNTERAANKYDFAHMSYENGRRQRIYGQFAGCNFRMAPNAWGEERDDTLRSTAWMLNVHQDDFPILEPLRFTLAAAYGLPMLTETCVDAYPYTRQGKEHCIVQANVDDLVSRAVKLISENYPWWRAMGLRCHHLMTEEYRFGKMVQQAVNDMPQGSTLEIK